MSFQTFSFELLQTKGEKGRALRTAMQLWTTTTARFLVIAKERYAVIDAIMQAPQSSKNLSKWVYDTLKDVPELHQMEPVMKLAICNTLISQLKSYFALLKDNYEPGFPTGRIITEADYPSLLEEFVMDSHINTAEGDYVTLQGLVSGFGKKSQYLPIEFHYYKPEKGFFIAKSKDNKYFAGLYIEQGNAGFNPVSDDLVIVGTGEKVVPRKKQCKLYPLAMSKWLQRKLEKYTADTFIR